MLTIIGKSWNEGGFWGKAYVVFSIIVIIMLAIYLWEFFRNSSKKRLDFIAKAQKAGNFVACKLTCLTKEGRYDDAHYKAEYMYVVDDKRYFVTYQMEAKQVIDNAKDDFDADMMVTQIKKYMILFYDPANPKKVMCKAEAFVSKNAMYQINTPKHNAYRNVDKDWTEAIDLVQY